MIVTCQLTPCDLPILTYLALAIIQSADTGDTFIPGEYEADPGLSAGLLLDRCVDRQLVVVCVCRQIVLQWLSPPLFVHTQHTENALFIRALGPLGHLECVYL